MTKVNDAILRKIGKILIRLVNAHDSLSNSYGSYYSNQAFDDIKYLLKEKDDACVWTYDDDSNLWRTSCGEEVHLTDGTPKENNFKFCVYCGKPLIEGD